MNTNRMSRRSLALALSGLVAAAGVAATTSPAAAFQGNMEHSLDLLSEAIDSLRQATPNKGGHRERAIQLIQQALAEVQAGIDFAAARGGGGF